MAEEPKGRKTMKRLTFAMIAALACSPALAADERTPQKTRDACFALMAPLNKPGPTFSMVSYPPSKDLLKRLSEACVKVHGQCSWIVPLSFCGRLTGTKSAVDVPEFQQIRPGDN